MEKEQIKSIIKTAADGSTLKKIVFSKARDKSILKCVAAVFSGKNGLYLQIETFTKDNKAHHTNLSLDESYEKLSEYALNDFMQTNIITSAGECEVKVSKSGSIYIGNKIKSGGSVVMPLLHNKEKHYILDSHLKEAFLYKLGITDKNGRIHDKMQSKYRQINRFLELVNDMKSELTKKKNILVYDLCCGKSYLSFALYFYLEKILGLEVEMTGADLKRDVVDYCNTVAASAHMNGLRFICGDITTLGLDGTPDMVVSLHACDIATDIVLAHAIKSGARMILSTPCCHHELFANADKMSQTVRNDLGFVLKHSMSAQKLCENLTDSLRAKTLEAYGYDVDLVELVTPDDTPKNLLIRARAKAVTDNKGMSALEDARRFIGVELTLEKLLK
ncbi:MAG: SAM-dependent methyltransferase [Clostridia bacterium]|nr:SAM-dependent methyltransferase [Clostridia bacterium]